MGKIDGEVDAITLTHGELRELTRTLVQETLTQLGVEHNNPLEMQKDFQHLREWRESTDAIKRKGMMTLVGIATTAIIGAIALGVKEYFGS